MLFKNYLHTIRTPKHLTFLGSALILLSLFLDSRIPRPTVEAMNNFESSAFHGRDIPDPLSEPSPGTFREISTPEFTFYSQTPPNVQDVMIDFRYSCQPSCPQLWLELQNQPDVISPRFVIYHHTLIHMPWFGLYRNNFFLYQRDLTFKDVESFISQIPSGSVIDQTIMSALKINQTNITTTENLTSLDNQQYILTTYQPPRQHHGWYRFTRALNIRQAQRDSTNQLIWRIKTYNQKPETRIYITYPDLQYK